jgi:hypothetical protein
VSKFEEFFKNADEDEIAARVISKKLEKKTIRYSKE